jgi:hypothetical protein
MIRERIPLLAEVIVRRCWNVQFNSVHHHRNLLSDLELLAVVSSLFKLQMRLRTPLLSSRLINRILD